MKLSESILKLKALLVALLFTSLNVLLCNSANGEEASGVNINPNHKNVKMLLIELDRKLPREEMDHFDSSGSVSESFRDESKTFFREKIQEIASAECKNSGGKFEFIYPKHGGSIDPIALAFRVYIQKSLVISCHGSSGNASTGLTQLNRVYAPETSVFNFKPSQEGSKNKTSSIYFDEMSSKYIVPVYTYVANNQYFVVEPRGVSVAKPASEHRTLSMSLDVNTYLKAKRISGWSANRLNRMQLDSMALSLFICASTQGLCPSVDSFGFHHAWQLGLRMFQIQEADSPFLEFRLDELRIGMGPSPSVF